MNVIEMEYELVIVGGGMSGVCAALAAARHGAKTALIHDRPVLGGNASGEFRMHICGADRHAQHPGLRETGILEEILLEVKRVNSNPSFWALDLVLWDKCSHQPGLTTYLNTYVGDLVMEGERIVKLHAVQPTSELRYEFKAALFMDATGDATIAHLSGAETRSGREGRGELGEHWAPEVADHCTMGSSLLFTAVDMGHPVKFEKPNWARTYTEEDLAGRDHTEMSSGYWWIELGGDELDVIHDAEQIRDELIKSLMGVWDHIKNGGDHGAENYALNWMAFLPGKRESRRVMGDYILREQDLLSERVFDDAIAYGGWSMDCHVPGGLRSSRQEPTQYLGDFGAYTIPYRCLYSKNIANLFVVGRAISVSHMAFSSTRVMGTCAVVGQAGGTAAAMAVKMGLDPRGMVNHIGALQNALMRDDCFLPGYRHEDPTDVMKCAFITSSNVLDGCDASNVQNGFQRSIDSCSHQWASPLCEKPAWLRARFSQAAPIEEIVLRFDSNLNREIMPSISERILAKQRSGVPETIVRDYTMQCLLRGQCVHEVCVRHNAQRMNRHTTAGLIFDEVLLVVEASNGDGCARVFEINAYQKTEASDMC